jgi:hypothetical protein
MPTDHPEDKPNPDQLLARLIEMEALVKRQTSALNALEVERDHFKGAFEEADAERQRLELVIRQLLRAQFGRKPRSRSVPAHPGKPRAGDRGGQGPPAEC